MTNLETLIIRINKEQNRNQDREVIQVLTEENTDELPFELPEFFDWPTGPQSVSRKGRLLMLAGIKYMKERYPKAIETTTAESIAKASRQAADKAAANSQWQHKEATDKVEPLPYQGERPAAQALAKEPTIEDDMQEVRDLHNEDAARAKPSYDISLFQ
ncbi:MAG: hypothetical protein ACOH5I_10190 [Oligoflexus sp.]